MAASKTLASLSHRMTGEGIDSVRFGGDASLAASGAFRVFDAAIAQAELCFSTPAASKTTVGRTELATIVASRDGEV
jgi:hypothetical protein